jgi:hypothetical protein
LPLNIDIGCPTCERSLVNGNLQFSAIYHQEIFQARTKCLGCDKEAHLFIVNWEPTNDLDNENARIFIDPSPKVNFSLPTGIDFESIAPGFTKIYRQVAGAESSGFDELVGMGYRKALEFLIKEFLIGQRPDDEGKIRKMTLGQCIENCVDNPNLKAVATGVNWLANDETHFERRTDSGDIDDLKALMDATLYWISMEVRTKRAVDEKAARDAARQQSRQSGKTSV